MDEQRNCYGCAYRDNVPGDAHSACYHPDVREQQGIVMLLLMFGAGRIEVSTRLTVQCNRHGIASGWCAYPINFDPIWIESCTGFEAKKV